MVEEKKYDLEQRTEKVAGDVAVLCNSLFGSVSNREHCKQVVRSSGSIAANYIEANEALSKKDFIYRLKICRKEAKETAMWFRIMMRTNIENDHTEIKMLLEESIELKRIFAAIIIKSGG